MRKTTFLLALVFVPLTLSAAPAFKIEPCTAFGPIGPHTTREALTAAFGAGNLQDLQIEGPEGENYPGTVVFPNDPAKKVKVIWQDDARRVPVEISVEGARSEWKTPQGVTLGMGLKELEKLNGAPFTVSGFEWDYGGRVLSWNDGALAKVFPKKLSLRLEPKTHPVPPSVSGDRNLTSNLPALNVVAPAVTEIACILQ